MSVFTRALKAARPKRARVKGRQWVYVPYDQLTDSVGPLAEEPPAELGIVLVESLWKPQRRPYHKQKLALVLASQRHFALEQARRGVLVHYLTGEAPYSEQLAGAAEELGPLTMMEPAELELREHLADAVARGLLQVRPNELFLTTPAEFEASIGSNPPWRMDRFYRAVRRSSGLLMEGGKPVGGRFSFDGENRKPWKGTPAAPEVPRFVPDEITVEVAELVAERFADHPGELDVELLPVTAEHAEAVWAWAKSSCLPHFGPYEDAMALGSANLFHSRLSPLLNNGRLLARRIVEEAAELDIPIPSKEGFIRQILGWREFMRHVHRATEGFRKLPEGTEPGGLDATAPLPPAFWGEPSGLHCLDHVVSEVWATGYGHHITRLMVLSNLATLLGVDARALSEWFYVAYVDAYDWVVEPNVLGMGTFSLGDLFTTKPYVSGARYIDRMSDYCGACAFSAKRNCPVTPMYWAFLERNRDALTGNPRVAMPLRSLEKRGEAQRAADRAVAQWARERMAAGKRLTPDDLPDPQ